MRYVAVDFGARRLGLACSDATGSLARAWRATEAARTPALTAAHVASIIRPLLDEDDGVEAIVVGLPRRLDGSDTSQTAPARTFAAALAQLVDRPVHLQDERLTSVAAEERLAAREPDWRKRKALIDAEAAAIILQDFLDARARASIQEDARARAATQEDARARPATQTRLDVESGG
jgi:putative Holliday junction resolvase